MNSRKTNTLRNLIWSFFSYFLNILLSFIVRTVFIKSLSTEYLGVSGLFTNILSLLSLIEVGAGGAFVSVLYKPLYDHDESKIAAIMKAFKKVYFIIASIIGILGLSITPFINYLIADNNINNISLIYVLFIINSVFYYISAAEIALIKAHQEMYIVTIINQIVSIVQYALQIIILVFTSNYILFLIIQIICNLFGNISFFFISRKKFPYLRKKKVSLDDQTKENVIEKIKGGSCLHLGYVISSGTDSIIISSFLGLSILGIYSNYLLIIGIFEKIVMMIFESVRASASDYIVSNDCKNNYIIYKRIEFLNIIIMGFITTSLIVLFNPFIRLWLFDEKYILDIPVVVLATLIYFFGWHGIKLPMSIFRDALGLYYKDRFIYLIEGFLNLLISVILVRIIGLIGVFLGTVFSSFITMFSGSYLVYKYAFRKNVWLYWKDTIIYIIELSVVAFISYWLVNFMEISNWLDFILTALIVIVFISLMYLLLFYKKKEFKYYYSFLKELIMDGKNNE